MTDWYGWLVYVIDEYDWLIGLIHGWVIDELTDREGGDLADECDWFISRLISLIDEYDDELLGR